MIRQNRKTGKARQGLTRRSMLKGTALVGAAFLAPAIVTPRSRALAASLAPYLKAKINWRMGEGESITVGVIPATYFENLITITREFEELSGISVRYEKIPPGQIRQKVVLDLSAKTGTYNTHAADPMYYSLYVANGWVDPLDEYLEDSRMTDGAWFDYEDINQGWREATSLKGRPYGIPYDGEATVQVYRKDIYDKNGLRPAETLDEYAANAKAIHDPGNRLWGCALRGFAGAGQNMYIFPSLFLAYGGKWLTPQGKIKVNGPEAVAALEYYVNLLNSYAPSGVQNWNWPDIADAFSQGIIGSYIDAHSSSAVIANPEKSKVLGKIGFARWPKGPSGRRVTSIWNWSFPINGALSKKGKTATWLFIQWAASKETQARTSYKFQGPTKRSGVNRTSIWASPAYTDTLKHVGANFIEATTLSLKHDTDAEWRPRVPQWPAIGDTMAIAIQGALVGQDKPREALNKAQAKIDKIMRA